MNRRRLLVGALLLALAVVGARDLSRLGPQLPWHQMFNFPAFYCAGKALDAGRSPYTYEPQRSCQHGVAANDVLRKDPALVIPTPQPPYALLPFMLLARLDFQPARTLYAAAILLAVMLSAIALTRVAIPLDLALLALALSAGYLQINDAQIVPFTLLCIVLSGVALAAHRDWLAGVFVVLAAIEPHLALPAILALFILAPATRWPIAITAAILGVAGVLSVGGAGVVEYLTRVLPAHAMSEIDYPYQFSLTYGLNALGVPAHLAQLCGDLSFAALCAAGVWLASVVSRRLGARELLAYIPAACAVTAGPFLHMVDIPLAIPAALVLATRLARTQRTVAAIALCVLAIPWIQVWGIKKLFATTIFVCGAMLFRLGVPMPALFATVAGLSAIIYAFEIYPAASVPLSPLARSFGANDLAQAAWTAYTQQLRSRDPGWLLVKLPVWSALGALLILAYRIARQAPRPQS